MSNSIPMHLHTLPPLLADLGYSMLVPEGFVQGQLPNEDVDFGNPTQFAPLAIFASPVAMAIITVAARPAYETGSVVQWMRYLMEHYELEAESVRVGRVGQSDEHPALIISAKQEQEGQKLRFAVVAFEDGGRFLNVQGICPEELWPSFGTALTEAVRSVTLASPKGPIHDLDSMDAEGWERITPQQYKKQMAKHAKERQAARAPAIAKAETLLAENLFDEAEREIMRVDSTIEGSVAIARIYEAQLQSLVAGGKHKTNRKHAEMLFHRALSWAQSCYPEAHTEVEAENYQQGRIEDRARLVKILGWDPDAA